MDEDLRVLNSRHTCFAVNVVAFVAWLRKGSLHRDLAGRVPHVYLKANCKIDSDDGSGEMMTCEYHAFDETDRDHKILEGTFEAEPSLKLLYKSVDVSPAGQDWGSFFRANFDLHAMNELWHGEDYLGTYSPSEAGPVVAGASQPPLVTSVGVDSLKKTQLGEFEQTVIREACLFRSSPVMFGVVSVFRVSSTVPGCQPMGMFFAFVIYQPGECEGGGYDGGGDSQVRILDFQNRSTFSLLSHAVASLSWQHQGTTDPAAGGVFYALMRPTRVHANAQRAVLAAFQREHAPVPRTGLESRRGLAGE